MYRGDNYQNGHQSPGSQQWRGGPQSPPYGGSSGGSYPGSYPSASRSQAGAGDEDEDYSKSVSEIRQIFNKPIVQQSYGGLRMNAEPGSTSYVAKKPVFRKPYQSSNGNALDLGWVPKNKPSPHSQDRYAPASMRSPPINRRGNDLQNYRPPPTLVHHEPPEKPAWLGSLRPAGGPKVWEIQEQHALIGDSARAPPPPSHNQASAPVHSQAYPGGRGGSGGSEGYGGRESPVVVHNPKVQSLRYGPGDDAPVYGQRDADKAADSDSARVAHLQYNSPIGLYSKANALDVLKGQTKGKPGEGTLQITGTGGPSQSFNPNVQSDVYRMIKEEEEQRRGGGGGGRPVSGGRAPIRRPAPRQPSPPRDSGEQHSAKFHQLVNENNDQMDEYRSMPHHGTAYPGGSFGPTRGGPAGRPVSTGYDAGISDF